MPSRKKICFIINPVSGGKSKRTLPALIDRHLDHTLYNHEIHTTKGPGHGIELAEKAVESGAEVVVAVGGDGTVNEVSRGLINKNRVLGVIPFGSGNGFARHLKIPTRTVHAIKLLNNPKVVSVDTGMLNTHIFINVAGTGFDAHIAHLFPKSGQRGFSGYTKLVLSEFYRYKSLHYSIACNGMSFSQNAFLLAFANGSEFGSGTTIAPKASVRDNLLDVCILKNFPLTRSPGLILRLFTNTVDRSPFYERIQTAKLLVEQHGANKTLIHLDGEPLFIEGNSFEVSLRPNSLKVIPGSARR